MRYLKMFAIAALAALALSAVVGVGSAGAETTLCKATENTCSLENAYGEGTELSAKLATGTKSVFTAAEELPTIECAKSTAEAKTETAGTPEGKLSGLTFSECSNTVEVLEKGKLQVHWDAEHNARVTLSEFRIRVKALFGAISCDFGGEIKEGLTLTGGASPKIDVTAAVPVVQKTGSIKCPESAVWHAEYEVTKPTPLYVSPKLGETTLCKATENTCSLENAYGEGTELSAKLATGTKSVLTASNELPTIECAKSTAEGKTETTGTPEAKLSGLTFGECNQTVEVIEKGKLQIHWDAEHNARVTLSEFRFRVKASFGALSCDFGGTVSEGLTLTGGASPKIDVTAAVPVVQKTGSINCPESAVWHAEYEVTKPTPLYVSPSP